ncbi:MAG: hypothetical protein QOE08_872, partial [Thermoleophilaceae bacterium]|nr:hypothetical protein [Thermoleophilaceae bacterium]
MATGTTVQITMPEMGESVTEGTILDWLKQVGDEVELDEGIVEVSTDKVDTEVPSPATGILTEILVQPDETVPVGTVLGVISLNGGTPSGGGDGIDHSAPGSGTADDNFASDESAVEEAVHGAAAEEEGQEAKEAAENGSSGAPAPAGAEIVDITVPSMGESVSEGTVLEWLKKVGDRVEVEEGIVEISTDKVDAELPSPVAGTLVEILAEPDAIVATGSVVARIAVGDAAAAKPSAPAGQAAPAADKGTTPQAATGNGDANATPVASRMASAHGIDVSQVPGSGPRGRVTKEDVLAAVEGNGSPAPAKPKPAPTAPGAKPIRGPAATLVRFMNESRSIPTATSFRTLEVDTLDGRRKQLKAAGQKLSFTHLIAWAIIQAAKEMPVMAHGYAEEDGKPLRVDPGGVSLGLAVDVERKDGTRSLVVPVVKDANTLTFPEFVKQYDEFVVGARD